MRPHLLEINAFGPFAGTVSVDLDDLGTRHSRRLGAELGNGRRLTSATPEIDPDEPGERSLQVGLVPL